GGGAATDLAAFDGEVIARAIAELEVPVLTGIGHDIDRSVADEVAHACYKTPTACAQAVVAQVREVARRTEELWRAVVAAARHRSRREATHLWTCGRHVAALTRRGLAVADRDLDLRRDHVARGARAALRRAAGTLERTVGRAEAGARAHARPHEQPLRVAGHRSRREATHLWTCGRHVAALTRRGLAVADRDLDLRRDHVARGARAALRRAAGTLERTVGRVEAGARAHARAHEQRLQVAADRLAHTAPRAVAAASRRLDAVEAQVRALDPARALARGWSITRDGSGRVVRSAAAVRPGDALVTTLADGQVRSTVEATSTGAAPPDPDPPSGSTR